MWARLLTVYGVYLLAAMSPGPAVLYVMRTSVGSPPLGRRAALGVATATTLWVCVAALGLSALLKGSPRLMDLVRLVGGLYFLRLSWTLARSAANRACAEAPTCGPRTHWAAYAQGVATNATNPGTALFFTGLLGLYQVQRMPMPAQAAVYLGIPALSAGWYGALSLTFSQERLARAYLSWRRPLDAALSLLFLTLGAKLIAATLWMGSIRAHL